MKINTYFYILFITSILVLSKLSYSYEYSVSEKYNEIFTKNILSKDDVENYRKAYLFQEKCKWKSANKHLLKISDKSLVGHILAHRDLHPDCYRSKYLELYPNFLRFH